MTGIGFLGAGVIVKERHTVRGLTTAASIWITAAIGVVIGMGLYSAAGLGVALSLGALAVFRWVEAVMPALRYAKLVTRFPRQNLLSFEQLAEIITSHAISFGNPTYHLSSEGRLFEYEMTIRTHHPDNLRHLAETLSKMDQVSEFSILPAGD